MYWQCICKWTSGQENAWMDEEWPKAVTQTIWALLITHIWILTALPVVPMNSSFPDLWLLHLEIMLQSLAQGSGYLHGSLKTLPTLLLSSVSLYCTLEAQSWSVNRLTWFWCLASSYSVHNRWVQSSSHEQTAGMRSWYLAGHSPSIFILPNQPQQQRLMLIWPWDNELGRIKQGEITIPLRLNQ